MTDFIQPLDAIHGAYVVHIRAFEDARGRFMETFRREWFPQVDWTRTQHNRSDSIAGVLRGLHYHFLQVDYWVVTRGRIRAALADLRATSPTMGRTYTLEMGDGQDLGLFIPSGVAHGFVGLTDCTLTYTVNNYYDGGKDEHGVAWNDPDLAVDWGVTQPVLSGRDLQNPRWREIPEALRPR